MNTSKVKQASATMIQASVRRSQAKDVAKELRRLQALGDLPKFVVVVDDDKGCDASVMSFDTSFDLPPTKNVSRKISGTEKIITVQTEAIQEDAAVVELIAPRESSVELKERELALEKRRCEASLLIQRMARGFLAKRQFKVLLLRSRLEQEALQQETLHEETRKVEKQQMEQEQNEETVNAQEGDNSPKTQLGASETPSVSQESTSYSVQSITKASPHVAPSVTSSNETSIKESEPTQLAKAAPSIVNIHDTHLHGLGQACAAYEFVMTSTQDSVLIAKNAISKLSHSSPVRRVLLGIFLVYLLLFSFNYISATGEMIKREPREKMRLVLHSRRRRR